MTNNTTAPTLGSITDTNLIWIFAFFSEFLLALIGNSVILCVFWKDNRLRTTTNLLVTNMAVSDLLTAILLFPDLLISLQFGHKWRIPGNFGKAMCKIYTFLIEVSFVVSLYSCAFMAIDRLAVVFYPTMQVLGRKIHLVIALVWFLSGLLKCPYLYYISTSYKNESGKLVCYYDPDIKDEFRVYDLANIILAVVPPFLVVSLCYPLTVFKVYRHYESVQNDLYRKRRRQQQNRKVLKISLSIVVVLYFSWAFRLVVYFLDFQGALAHLSIFELRKLLFSSNFMHFVSLFSNFFIYLIFSDVFREHARVKLNKCFFACCSVIKAPETSPRVLKEEMMVIDKNGGHHY